MDAYSKLLNNPAYQCGETFFPSISEFSLMYNSLHRYWSWSKSHNREVLGQLQEMIASGKGPEHEMLMSETTEVDLKAFPVHLRLSVITMAFSILEGLVRHVTDEIANELQETKEAVVGREVSDPYGAFTARYMTMLSQWYGLIMGPGLDGTVLSELGHLRQTTYDRLGLIDASILDDIVEVTEQLAVDAQGTDHAISDEDVDLLLHHLSTFAKSLEEGLTKYSSSLKE